MLQTLSEEVAKSLQNEEEILGKVSESIYNSAGEVQYRDCVLPCFYYGGQFCLPFSVSVLFAFSLRGSVLPSFFSLGMMSLLRSGTVTYKSKYIS